MSMYDFEATYGSTRSLSSFRIATNDNTTTSDIDNTATTQQQQQQHHHHRLLKHHQEKKYDTTTTTTTTTASVEDGIQIVLREIENDITRRVDAGFNIRNFTIGVINTFVIVYIFGAYPQHFWILYIVESCILIPIKYYDLQNQKPLCGICYLLDYCWCMNFIGVIVLMVFIFTLKHDIMAHKIVYQTAFGVACGPLMGACLVLPFCALVFHNWGTMCDLFIHIFPPMVMYTAKWNSIQVQKAWPNIFEINSTSLNEEIPFFGSIKTYNGDGGTISANTMILYFIWLIPYLIWMGTCGMNLPSKPNNATRKRYDTVFHSTMRGGLCITLGKKLFDRSIEESKKQITTNIFEWNDFYMYMIFHFLLVLSSVIFLAYPCYKSQYIHATFLWIMAIVCATRGAMRYTYYSTDMYIKLIQNILKKEETNTTIEEEEDENNNFSKTKIRKQEQIGGGIIDDDDDHDNESTPLLI